MCFSSNEGRCEHSLYLISNFSINPTLKPRRSLRENFELKKYTAMDVVDVLLIRSMFEICVFGSFAKWKGHKFWPDKSLCDTPKMYYLKCFLLVFQVSYKTYLGYFLFISKYDFCTGIYNKNIFYFRVFVLEWL